MSIGILRWLALLALAFGTGWLIWLQRAGQPPSEATGLALERILSDEASGFPRADGEWDYRFPADHGGHPEFRSEVWYLTGNLQDDAGQDFGFQLAFFRLRLTPATIARRSRWSANQVFRAHFALTDVASGRFHAEERFSRAALGLSGVGEAPVRVWLEDWVLAAMPAQGGHEGGVDFRMRAESRGLRLDLELRGAKPPVLDGAADLLGSTPGGRGPFHFYLLSRLEATGALRDKGVVRKVRGAAWLDRAWGAVPLSRGQIALNRFALQLDDGRELLCLQLRRRDGSGTPIPSCLLVAKDGSTKSFRRREIRLELTGHWRSRRDGTNYPLHWRLELPQEGLALRIEPLVEGQELDFTTRAWSGAVTVSGRYRGEPASGRGHLELGGYAGA